MIITGEHKLTVGRLSLSAINTGARKRLARKIVDVDDVYLLNLNREKGHLLVDAMEQLHIDLSPEKTVELQRQIHDVQEGALAYTDILEATKKIIDEIISRNSEIESKYAASATGRKNIGICPRCGSPVYEGKLNFYCSKGKECGFALWKSNKLLESMKVNITQARAQKLLENKKVFIKGLYSKKKDARFDAFIAYEDTGSYVNYKIEFGKA